MTCQECEVLLASEETSAGLEGHLAECVECRELAAELRVDEVAFREMSAVELPSVSGAVLAQVRARETRRQVARWGWALAAAAAIVIGFFATRQATRSPAPQIAEAPAKEVQRQAATSPAPQERQGTRSPALQIARASRQQATRSPVPQEALKVKMFTSDPDVVIYWLVDPKEGSE